ncbi:MAG: transketolase [Acidobacteria bacterium]|nr:transketolase [Acidobacteriota bacterium]
MRASSEARDQLCINTIRMLSIDAVQKADSGHPGMPMGAATMAYVLWTRHLRHNPKNPAWPDRDRFVLSAGHGSMLLYGLLFLTGYDLALDDIEQFRQWNSRTPGHPEHGLTPGVEVTTGPLGQGFGNSVGLAIAERWLAATFNRPDHDVVDHCTYVIASDGDLMEGVASEAASLAGTLKLGRLIVLYDANRITLSATTNVTFTEDVGRRFEAYGWHVQRIDGLDPAAVDAALALARADEDRPSLIIARTHIGYGSPHKQDTWHAHGEPLGAEEVRLTKRALGWPEDRAFYVPDDALHMFRRSVAAGAELEKAWRQRIDAYRTAHSDMADRFARALSGELPAGWESRLPAFTTADGDMATRDAGGKVLDALASVVPNLIGGSADLDPSTRSALKGCGDFESPQAETNATDWPTQGAAGGPWGYEGRNVHYGLREHAMAAILTGAALHGGLLPFGATFLAFSDYMRPAIRLAALSRARVTYIWTHDSIALGEDGPTHQPVEQLAGLRAMPNLIVMRPSDATETVEAWRVALAHAAGPVGLVLTRQKLPVIDRKKYSPASGLARGAYVLADGDGSAPQVILIATGSEVSIALEAHERLARDGIRSRVVSMPCWKLFDAQPQSYRDAVLPPGVSARVSIEAASPFGWERYVGREGAIIGLNRFGASAPGPTLMRELGFSPEHLVETAKAMLKKGAAS